MFLMYIAFHSQVVQLCFTPTNAYLALMAGVASSASSVSCGPAASSADGSTGSQDIVLPAIRKRSRVENPVVHRFKLFHGSYAGQHENILRLHAENNVITEQYPDRYHGMWEWTACNDLHIKWHCLGDETKLKDHTYRRVPRTQIYERINYGNNWYSQLIPVSA